MDTPRLRLPSVPSSPSLSRVRGGTPGWSTPSSPSLSRVRSTTPTSSSPHLSASPYNPGRRAPEPGALLAAIFSRSKIAQYAAHLNLAEHDSVFLGRLRHVAIQESESATSTSPVLRPIEDLAMMFCTWIHIHLLIEMSADSQSRYHLLHAVRALLLTACKATARRLTSLWIDNLAFVDEEVSTSFDAAEYQALSTAIADLPVADTSSDDIFKSAQAIRAILSSVSNERRNVFSSDFLEVLVETELVMDCLDQLAQHVTTPDYYSSTINGVVAIFRGREDNIKRGLAKASPAIHSLLAQGSTDAHDIMDVIGKTFQYNYGGSLAQIAGFVRESDVEDDLQPPVAAAPRLKANDQQEEEEEAAALPEATESQSGGIRFRQAETKPPEELPVFFVSQQDLNVWNQVFRANLDNSVRLHEMERAFRNLGFTVDSRGESGLQLVIRSVGPRASSYDILSARNILHLTKLDPIHGFKLMVVKAQLTDLFDWTVEWFSKERRAF
ncbi:hypothetical protein BKA62DRAFT_699739 [Auriculariales sp. MPI-PUGE-AT-0066]|nr:hypothetical protein BKA62DRAFT_699739 [Auriculariales sp. MPI-PUGE-AT-0066]